MTNYRVNREPSAIVLVKNSRSGSLDESKIYSGNQIFLEDKQQFVFKLFNPLQEKIGVSIKFNGKSDTNSLLVLNPGEETTIERFLDTNRKMVFETYEIDAKNAAAKNAIQNNGLIEFNFYKEKQNYNYFSRSFSNGTFNVPYTTCGNSTITLDNANFKGCSTITSNINYCSSASLNLDMTNLEDNVEKEETGRIEKGDVSNQNFINVNVDFESYSFYSIHYKLLPVSAKKDQPFKVRQYCTQCGKRIKDSYLYCPLCGAKNE
jgi:hypothetical protein